MKCRLLFFLVLCYTDTKGGMHMQVHDPILITDRDRVLRAWQNLMELIRDFQLYAREVDDPSLSAVFARFSKRIPKTLDRKIQLYLKKNEIDG